ncbi:MAG: hypothetical protein R3E89_16110 [Thiolinea sp.]
MSTPPSQRPESEKRIQVIDRASALLEAITRYPEPVGLKILSAETGLHPLPPTVSCNHWSTTALSNAIRKAATISVCACCNWVCLHSSTDLRALALPYMKQLRDQLGDSVNLTMREGDVVVYIEKATPSRMMHVQQIIGSRAPCM